MRRSGVGGDDRDRKSGILAQLSRHRFVYTYGVIIPLTLTAVFVLYPLVRVFLLSLREWNGVSTTMPFIGLQNYLELARDPQFRLSLLNTAEWAALTVVFPVVGGLLLAVLLHSGRILWPSVFRAILFLPSTMSLVGIGLMFSLMLNPSFGGLNTALQSIGLGAWQQDWLGDKDLALLTLIVVFAWGYTGLAMILFYGGIGQIPAELYEAAHLEGSNAVQRLVYITVPMLRPVTVVTTMLAVINSLRSFDLVIVMTRGGPFMHTTTLGYYMYTMTFGSYRFGYGAAISVTILLLSVVFAFIYIRNIAGEALYVS